MWSETVVWRSKCDASRGNGSSLYSAGDLQQRVLVKRGFSWVFQRIHAAALQERRAAVPQWRQPRAYGKLWTRRLGRRGVRQHNKHGHQKRRNKNSPKIKGARKSASPGAQVKSSKGMAMKTA